MAYISNPKLYLRIKMYKKTGTVLSPISIGADGFITDSVDPTIYTIKDIALLESGGVGSITHQIERNGGVINTNNLNIQLDNSDESYGSWVGASGIFSKINNENIFYDCQVLVYADWVELESSATDRMVVNISDPQYSANRPRTSTVEPPKELAVPYQILYGGYIDHSSWNVDNWNKKVTFTIFPYTWWMKKWEFPNSFRSYQTPAVILETLAGYGVLTDETGIADIVIKDNVIKNKFTPIVKTAGIIDDSIGVTGLYPYDVTTPSQRYCLQVETSTGIKTYKGNPSLGWTEDTGYTADYRNGKPIQPTNSGYKDLKSATTGWGASFSTGGIECPYNVSGVQATDSATPNDQLYNILNCGVRWGTWDVYGDIAITGAKCPMVSRSDENGQTRFIYSVWNGTRYAIDGTGASDLLIDVQGSFFDMMDDKPGFVILDDIGSSTRNQAAFTDGLIYTYNNTDNASFPYKFRVIQIAPQTIGTAGTSNNYYAIVEINKDDKTFWQTLTFTAEILTPPVPFGRTALTRIDFTTVSDYKKFSPIPNWGGSNYYKAHSFYYKGEMCWGLTYTKQEDGVTNAYFEIRDFNGNQKNISLLIGNIDGDVVTCIDTDNNIRDTWRLVYAGYSNDLGSEKVITGELRVLDVGEQIDTNYRIPYLYRSDTNYADVLTKLAQSYGYVWWIRPDKVMQWIPREKFQDSVRDDTALLVKADGTWTGGYWDNKYDQVTYKYGASDSLVNGSGVNINIEMPYLQSKDMANALVNNYYAFYGLRKWGTVDMLLYYTQLFNGVQIGIEWMVWKVTIQVGIDNLNTNLELLEGDVSNISTNELIDCLYSPQALYISGGVWVFDPLGVYDSCDVCRGCETELLALTGIWIDILNEGGYTFSEYWAGFDDIMSQFPRWESEMRDLLTCTSVTC